MEKRKRFDRERRPEREAVEWIPQTALGRKVKSGEVNSIQTLLESNEKILESGIVDTLVQDLETDYINIGQSKGKFGGGKRRIIKQTQKKTEEGSKISFCAIAVVGNKKGLVGVGVGKAIESRPAKEKALRKAKMNIMSVPMGCGSWECGCGSKHSLPFEITGRCGSVRIQILPAPKGTGLAVENELKKILGLAGYRDLWSNVTGQSRRKENLISACMIALKKGNEMKILEKENGSK